MRLILTLDLYHDAAAQVWSSFNTVSKAVKEIVINKKQTVYFHCAGEHSHLNGRNGSDNKFISYL